MPLELEILAWMKRPVLLLLNQVGREGDALVSTWRRAVERWAVVGDVLSLDAFTRCWVEEGRPARARWNRCSRSRSARRCGRCARRGTSATSPCSAPAAAGSPTTSVARRRTASPCAAAPRPRASRGAVDLLRDALKPGAPGTSGGRCGPSTSGWTDATRELMEKMIAAHGLTGDQRREDRAAHPGLRGQGRRLASRRAQRRAARRRAERRSRRPRRRRSLRRPEPGRRDDRRRDPGRPGRRGARARLSPDPRRAGAGGLLVARVPRPALPAGPAALPGRGPLRPGPGRLSRPGAAGPLERSRR